MAGININVLRPEHLAYIARVRPPVNFLKDPKYESAAEIKSASPESKLIGRPYMQDGALHNWYLEEGTAAGAQRAGKQAAQLCLDQGVPQCDAWILLNEPPVATVGQIQLLAEFDAEFARAMSKGGSKACIGAFSRGTPQIPREDGGAALSAYSPALRVVSDVGAWLTFHAYGKYPLYLDAEYLALRWQRHILPWYRAQGVPIPRYVITECGVDLGTGIDAENNDGWRKTPYNDDIPAYGRDLLMLMREYAKDPACIGATIFCAGHAGWESFVVDGPLLDHLATISWPKFGAATPAPSPSPTPTPKPETPMPIPSPIKPPHEWLGSVNYTPGVGRAINTIVYHHTGGPAAPSLSWLRDPDSGVSTHYLVEKTGKTWQLVSDDNIAWQAGFSRMPDGRENVNLFSIGIEIVNQGDGLDIYPQVQIDAVASLARYLVAKYSIKRESNVTHELIRRLWKQKYPNRLDDQGRPISYKTDPRGLDMVKLLDRVYAPAVAVAPINQMIELAKASQLVSPNTEAALTKAAVKAGYTSQLGNEGELGGWLYQLWSNPASGKEALVYVKKGDWGNVVVRGL